MKTKQGISLIVLVITIIVLAILASVIIINLSNTNIIGLANETVLKNDLAAFKESYSMYVVDQFASNSSFDMSSVNASYGDDIYTNIFGDVPAKYSRFLKVKNGVLIYSSTNEKDKQIAQSLGYKLRFTTPEEYFINCQIPAKEVDGGELTLAGQPCFDTTTGTLYSVNLPEGETELVIPETISGVKVNKIMGECWGIEPQSVTYMPETLDKVFIPAGVTVSNGAFSGDGDTKKIEVESDGYIKVDGAKWVLTDSTVKIANGSEVRFNGISGTPNYELEGNITFGHCSTCNIADFAGYDISMVTFVDMVSVVFSGVEDSSNIYMNADAYNFIKENDSNITETSADSSGADISVDGKTFRICFK